MEKFHEEIRKNELSKFQNAVRTEDRRILRLYQCISQTNPAAADRVALRFSLLHDSGFSSETERLITEGMNAESAVSAASARLCSVLGDTDREYFCERINDIRENERLLIKRMRQNGEKQQKTCAAGW